MSNSNDKTFDLQSTALKIENLSTALTALIDFYDSPEDIRNLASLLVGESEALSSILNLCQHIPDQALSMGLLRGLPLDAKHKLTPN